MEIEVKKMDYTVTVKTLNSNEPLVIINRELARKLDLIRKKRGYISFGILKNYVDITLSDKVAENELLLSSKIMDSLHVPDYVGYEIRRKGNGIILGPCIGILASKKDEAITKRRLKEISMSVLDYGQINGAIIVFSLEKVDTKKLFVEGYCYNPQKDSWEPGVFPYPMAIQRRSGLNEKWQNHFLSVIGDNVFNNYSFDKWDMHEWFSTEPEIAPHLPHTCIYESSEDLQDMLQRYKVLYVKPIWGMKGFGVIKVSLEDSKVAFQYRENGKNVDILQEDEKDIENTMERLFEPGDYIIQQGLDLIHYDGGIIDIRCVMQKNEAFQWVCNGMIARIGAKESVVSNISNGGAALPAIDLIREALPISEAETFIIKEKIISLCMKVCRALNDYGFNYGTLGLDIGIDTDLNVWLIEVNNRRPHPGIALRANDILAYYAILASPLHYAKALAGFGRKEEENDVL
jgi:glutathione synthase/RimK-type ligase-like ATP-grasp enzyme